eukprot:TRINITY_DN5225_c0_g3_i1.p1 TRINITY_DN5225_c0_g3~~TRINITY_DN5225_c0_g3_i1.p1  ORF type:complete len:735 (+),score=192.15 TRINITY_DN5225_c0_g3_i1:46-2205(+)
MSETEAALCPTLAAEIIIAANGARTAPGAMGALVESEELYVDSQQVLILPGWDRGIQLREGSAAYEVASEFMKKQEALPPLVHSAALQKAADRAALRMAEHGGIEHVHPENMTLLQSVRMYGKVSGLIEMNCSRGFFNTGNSVVISWIVHDGDADRTHRETFLRKEAGYMGIAAAEGTDGRIYIAGIFADTCWDLEDNTDIIATLFTAYDENDDGALDHEEYSALCNDLSIESPNSQEDFTLLCEHVNKAPHKGGMTTEGLRAVAGDLLAGKADLINQLVSAKRAGKSVLRTSNQVNIDKMNEASKGAAQASLKIDKHAVLRRLIKMWEAKKGDILDEMLANYKAPVEGEGKLLLLAEVARKLKEAKSTMYPNRNRIDLLNMALYTMAGPDIDMVMSYPGVPEYDEMNTAQWDEYKTTHKDRNGAMFSAINWAMRMASADPKGTGEAWDTVGKWIKTICLFMSLCGTMEAGVRGMLSRGLAALPQSVVDLHNGVVAGEEIVWGAPSSCATDPTVAENYVNGAAANATKGSGGSVLFSISSAQRGIPLQSISKYPKEAEVLLSPLSTFKIFYRGLRSAPNSTDIVSIEMASFNSSNTAFEEELRGFIGKCLVESENAVPRLLKQTEQLDKTIPQTLAAALGPATRPYNAEFFTMRRKLRGMSHGGGPSMLHGGNWHESSERSLSSSPQAAEATRPATAPHRTYYDTPVGGQKAMTRYDAL